MDLEDCVRKYIKEGYALNDARSKVSQDVILIKIAKSNFKHHITVKGGVVMHNMSNSVLKLGFRSTRYKDLFDFYYLITNDKLDKRKLLETMKILIFDDSDMYEKNWNNPKYNWLDISLDEAIKVVLDFILELETKIVEV